MKTILKIIPLLSILSCSDTMVKVNQITENNKINSVMLFIKPDNYYYSSKEDWFAVAANSVFDVDANMIYTDTLGNEKNLNRMVLDSGYVINYKFSSISQNKIVVYGEGLKFNIRTFSPQFDSMYVTVLNKQLDTVYKHIFPMILSTP
jgi:hypothetical protein